MHLVFIFLFIRFFIILDTYREHNWVLLGWGLFLSLSFFYFVFFFLLILLYACRERNMVVMIMMMTMKIMVFDFLFELVFIILFICREHNRVVEELRIVNPHWDGDRLYQEGRKVAVINQNCPLPRHYDMIIVIINCFR